MAPALGKSSSVPGLMKLGTAPPAFLSRSQKGFEVRTDDVKQLADLVRTGFPPRFTATEPYTHKNKLDLQEEIIAGIPRNMSQPRIAPSWLKHDKQVLRFYGYFQENVPERADENARFRHVEIMYFIEDGTLKIIEPKIENSGIPQGAFLKRHRALRDDGMGYVGPDDLRNGVDITLYKRTYRITGCDRFTRWFYEENGVDVGEEEPAPVDHWTKSYAFKKTAEKGGLPVARSTYEAKHLTKVQAGQTISDLKEIQFLMNDRKVLRFKAYWDDHTLYGARIYFVIHYYLADNTMEINEAHCRNSGRDPYPVFMSRSPCYKTGGGNVPVPGMLAPDPVPYLPEDLRVGGSINVMGREIVLYDCDDFTNNFYSEFMQVDQKSGRIDVSDAPLRHRKLHPPPHNGIGTAEDSIGNVLRLVPKTRKVDLVKLMTLSGEVCRFEAKFALPEPEDEMRKFIIAYYPADDTVSCFEMQSRNSGHMAGKFMQKRRAMNPDTGRYFELRDLFIGGIVTLESKAFKITRADERCLKYLEDRAFDFPYADPIACAHKLLLLKDDPQFQSEAGVDPDTLLELSNKHGISLIDHEVVTLLRAFDVGGEEPRISGPSVLEVIGMST